MEQRKRGRALAGSAPEIRLSMLARGEAARDRCRTQLDDPELPPPRRRLAAVHLQVLQRQLRLIRAVAGE
ncbi:MAG: hypothetical protein AB7I59_21350 [Geminicoccaceae bacterium]